MYPYWEDSSLDQIWLLLLEGLMLMGGQSSVLLAAGWQLLDNMEKESAGGSFPDNTAKGTNCRELIGLLMTE